MIRRSNYELSVSLTFAHETIREFSKKLEFTKNALKNIAEAEPGISREQLIESAQAALSELDTRREWK